MPIREQLLRALDPDGAMRRNLAAAKELTDSPSSRELRRIAQEHEDLLDSMERHWEALTDRGWGVANVGVDLISRAGDYLTKGEAQTADVTIAGWFDTQWMSRVVARVAFITDGTAQGRKFFEQRARLLGAAQLHHEQGDFAASILIVLAQVEGITAQVTAPPEGGPGKLFFTMRDSRKADVVDSSDLASIQASLDRLRDVYSAGIPVVQADGALSRHGIMHGQELAFDTPLNSAKCWSLLDLLVQWALPRGRERDLRVAGQRHPPTLATKILTSTGDGSTIESSRSLVTLSTRSARSSPAPPEARSASTPAGQPASLRTRRCLSGVSRLLTGSLSMWDRAAAASGRRAARCLAGGSAERSPSTGMASLTFGTTPAPTSPATDHSKIPRSGELGRMRPHQTGGAAMSESIPHRRIECSVGPALRRHSAGYETMAHDRERGVGRRG